MRLLELLSQSEQFNNVPLNGIPDTEVTGISHDSRDIFPGNIFVALTGESYDGHKYIHMAVEKGACAVVGDQDVDTGGIPYLKVENTRLTLAFLSASFYDFPTRKMTVIGVTGTDGKTTTVNLIYNILVACGIKAGMVSTVNAVIGEEKIDTGFHVTTPEAPSIQKILKRMADSGITHVVIEATSHGLEQHRVSACEFDIGVVTNITHEHLDYHGNYDQYLKAKAALVTGLAETKPKSGISYRTAVLNQDDISYQELIRILAKEKYRELNIVAYGTGENVTVRGINIENVPEGLSFEITYENALYGIQSSLIGVYNAHNILAAISAAVLGLNLNMQCAVQGVSSLKGVPGRMERIEMGQEFSAIVDFAHTPNALKVALESSRKRTRGRVIAVFGSAGLRDKQKRRMMAATSLDLADITILTAEDPRTEHLEDILKEMADEAKEHGGVEGKSFFTISDRGEAISEAVQMAEKGDLVIICGKGHEQSMCFGEVEYPWDDRTALRSVLSSLMGISGPGIPFLPTQN